MSIRQGIAHVTSALVAVCFALVIATGSSSIAYAQEAATPATPVPFNWSLKPSGLDDGDEFRLLFITRRSRPASSEKIGDYNQFVQDNAAAGPEAIRRYSSGFRVVGSTGSVDARDNTGTTGEGVPIYWLGGAKVADDYADFYDGTWDEEERVRRSDGSLLRVLLNSPAGRVYTGSLNNGTASSLPLGGDSSNRNRTTVGRLNSALYSPLTAGASTTSEEPYYGLSAVFRVVPAGTPLLDSIAISSDAGADRAYVTGEDIEATLTFDGAVSVTGSPYLRLRIGANTRYASYSGGSSSTALTFSYRVTGADRDQDGIAIEANALLLGDGAIHKQGDADTDAVSVNDATSRNTNHRVNVVPFTAAFAAIPDRHDGSAEFEVDILFSSALGTDDHLEEGVRLSGGTLQSQTMVDSREDLWRLTISPSGNADVTIVLPATSVCRVDANICDSGDAPLATALAGTVKGPDTPISTDATLSSVELSGAVLDPAFDSAETTYTAAAAHVIGVTTVAVSTTSADATVVIMPGDAQPTAEGHQVDLDVGANTITLEVSAEDGVTTKTYTIAATRASSEGAVTSKLVENFDQSSSTLNVQVGSGSGHEVAQRFRTGDHAGGYSLRSIALRAYQGGSDNVQVSLWTASGNNPGQHLMNLINPDNLGSSGTKTFTVPGYLSLDSSTTYVVVASFRGRSSGTLYLSSTSEHGEDSESLAGWTIHNGRQIRSHSGDQAWSGSGNPLLLRVSGVELPADTPHATGVALTSAPGADDAYATGDVIQATVSFSEAVTVDTTNGTPRLALSIGADSRYAAYSADDSSTTELVFAYTVTGDDHDQDGVSVFENALDVNGGAVHKEGDTNTAAVVDQPALADDPTHRVNPAPRIVPGGVQIITRPRATTDTYGLGEEIRIEVTFDDPVEVVGAPHFEINVDGDRVAALKRGSGTSKLVFAYTVQAGDTDADGIWIGNHTRAFRFDEGEFIRGMGTHLSAMLDFASPGTQAGHKVDATLTPPTTSRDATLSALALSGITVSPAFSSAATAYTALVSNSANSTVVTATATDDGAQVEIEPGDADTGTDGHQVNLAEGVNTITVTVTSSADTMQTYTVTVRRARALTPLPVMTLVSNRDQESTLYTDPLGEHERAQGFTTGRRASGYTLTSLEFITEPRPGQSAGALSVSLWTSDTGQPGQRIATFTNPSDLTSTGSKKFTAPEPVVLAPRTTYFAVLSFRGVEGNIGVAIASSNSEDSGSLSGWTIADSYVYRRKASSPTTAWTPLVFPSLRMVAVGQENAAVPFISSVAISSTAPGGDSSYETGDTVKATVTFSERVEVAGTPQLALVIGDRTRMADYSPTQSTEMALAFTYTVVAEDKDEDGISIGANALTLGGGGIQRRDANVDVLLSHNRVADQVAHKVHPTPFTATFDSIPETHDGSTNFDVDVQFGSDLGTVRHLEQGVLIDGGTLQTQTQVDGRENVWRLTISPSGEADVVITLPVPEACKTDDQICSDGDSPLEAELAGTVTGPISTDATLSSLQLSGVVLDPAFDSAETAYTAAVAHLVAVTTVTGVPTTGEATVVITPADAQPTVDGHQADLGVGDTTVTVEVLAEDGNTTQSYTVTVSRAPAESTLSSSRLVENFDQSSSTLNVRIGFGSGHEVAQRFVTGTHAGGYSLRSIALRAYQGGSDNVQVSLWTASGNNPSQLLMTLINPDNLGSSGIKTFTVPRHLTLDSSTSYVVLASFRGRSSGALYLSSTSESGEDSESLAGWSIADGRVFRSQSGNQAWSGNGNPLLLRVSGVELAADTPHASGVALTSAPGADDAYATGDVIQTTVSFSEAVTVDTTGGTPRLALSIGADARYAAYSADDSSATELVFAYSVTANDHDQDGVSIFENALDVNGGAVHKQGDTTTAAVVDQPALADDPTHRVNPAPRIVPGGVQIITRPRATADTYGLGEEIRIEVTFDDPVEVVGAPHFEIRVGDDAIAAGLKRGSGTRTLVFAYTVQAGDADNDGILIRGVFTPTLMLDDGEFIRGMGTHFSAMLDHPRVGVLPGHKVDARLTPPPASRDATLSALALSALALSDIALSPAFSSAATAYTALVSNSANSIVVTATATDDGARVEIEPNDADTGTDGHQVNLAEGVNTITVTVTSSADTMQTYTVTVRRAQALTPLPVMTLVSNRDQSTLANITLGGTEYAQGFTTGSRTSGYTLTSLQLISAPNGGEVPGGLSVSLWTSDADQPGQRIVTFTNPSDLASSGGKTFTASTPTVLAPRTAYFAVLSFRSADGGISIAYTDATSEDSASLSGWTIADFFLFRDKNNPPASAWSVETFRYRSLRMVAVGQQNTDAPVISSVAISSTAPGGNSSYETGDTVKATVTYNEAVEVAGMPQLALVIGDHTRMADYSATQSTETALVFAYTVVAEDNDEDGISIVANALTLGGGGIQRRDANVDVLLSHNRVADQVAHKVHPTPFAATFDSIPETHDGSTNFAVDVLFSSDLGSFRHLEQGALIAGGTLQSQARVDSRSDLWRLTISPSGEADVVITLPVAEACDTDDQICSDGDSPLEAELVGTITGPISSIATLSSLQLSGAVLDPAFDSAETAYTATVAHLVAVTTVTGVTTSGDATLVITPADAQPTVDGHQADLGVGETIVTVEVHAEDGNTTQSYTVAVSRAPVESTLSSSRLVENFDRSQTTRNVRVGSGFGHEVAQEFRTGNHAGGYSLRSIALRTYQGGSDNVQVSLWTASNYRPNQHLMTLINPQNLGSSGIKTFTVPRYLTLDSSTGYVVVASFRGRPSGTLYLSAVSDNGEDSESLAGWTIGDNHRFRSDSGNSAWTGNSASLLLRVSGVELAADTPHASGVALTSAPGADGAYATGNVIKATVSFSEAVTIDTTGGTPRLALSISGEPRNAAYSARDSSATELVFSYTVTAADHDQDGVSILESALDVNGGVIHKEGDTSTAAVVDHPVLADDPGHRIHPAPSIVPGGVQIITLPRAATDTYGLGEEIRIAVTFDDPVEVVGAPHFEINIAGDKVAALKRGSGTSELVFAYTVQAGDAEPNGIWIGNQTRTFKFDEGEFIRGIGISLSAMLDHAALGTQAGHKVNAALTPPAISGDATLASLDVGGLEFVPPFDSATLNYRASVPAGTAVVTVASTPTDSAAFTEIAPADDDDGTSGHQVNLGIGETPITVMVNATDDATTNTYTVTVTRPRATPVFTSPSAFAVNEGAIDGPADQNQVGQVQATNADGKEVTYAITGGADRALFAIDTESGVLSFKQPPDYETPTDVASTNPENTARNNEYVVVVTAASGDDEQEEEASQTLTVTVADLPTRLDSASRQPESTEHVGLTDDQASARPFVLVLGFSEPVTGIAADEFAVARATVLEVVPDCTGAGAHVLCVRLQAAGNHGERLTLGIPVDVADGGNLPAPAAYSAEIVKNSLTATLTSTATAPVGGALTVRLGFNQPVLYPTPLPGITPPVPVEEYLAEMDLAVTNGAITSFEYAFTDALSPSTVTLEIAPKGLFKGTLSVDLPAGAVLTAQGEANPAANFEIEVDTIAGSTLSNLALSGATLAPAFDAATKAYNASVADGASVTTVTATPAVAASTVEILPDDEAELVPGHQVVLLQNGRAITVTVTDSRNSDWTQTYSVRVSPGTLPSGLPTIAGVVQIDTPLTVSTSGIADTDGLTSPGYTYQWIRVDGGSETDLSGATGNTYTPVAEDVGKMLQVRVNFTDDDGNAHMLSSAATVAVGGNAVPSFTSAAAFEADENQTAAGTVIATDVDDDPVSYEISGGADQGKFEIDAGTGALSFKAAPDYENPTDAAGSDPESDAQDNEYVVVVMATGGTGMRTRTDTQIITVTVTNVIEAVTLEITGLQDASVPERTAYEATPSLNATPNGQAVWTVRDDGRHGDGRVGLHGG